ncbi:MAG: hypothetical protein B7X10_00025 [Burkholderiales bacterium 21-58-4]|nr:MAG: hypothetical protein B7X10_00025 [Burkholderiales bacterium 21-58-4]
MVQMALVDGSYEARSIIASAQRCVNLYPEENQLNKTLAFPAQMTNSIITHYPTPGLTLLATIGTGPIRCTYAANNGVLYVVSGAGVYAVNSAWQATQIGSIAYGTTPVYMADNSLQIALVDGTVNGYTITLATNAFAIINDPSFYGADGVDYIDTYLYFNKPGTPQFYSTYSEQIVPFDGLYFANKTGYADNLVRAVTMHREIWLIGEVSTEIWYDAGNSNFPFAEVPGSFIQHGCLAKYSVAVQDLSIFWLSQSLQGQRVVVMGANYAVDRISTHAIEAAIQQYAVVSDAEGYIYQQEGHQFYVLNFPTANKTWVYDIQTKLWHERMWRNPADSSENRIRARCAANIYEKVVCGDWQNGNLYYFDVNNYTDNGVPIERIRSFPTMQNELKRILYTKFIADMQVGSDTSGAGESNPALEVGLRYSDAGGQSWSDIMYQTNGAGGDFQTNMQWRRLGMGRRRVFELRWSGAYPTALNGAYIDVLPSAS